jgi:hypothetical protein
LIRGPEKNAQAGLDSGFRQNDNGDEKMSYTSFDASKPNPVNERVSDINAIRTNMTALRDAILMGAFKGFAYSWSGGTAEEPQYQFHKNGTTWLRAAITWSSGGPANIVYELSTYSGANYATIGTLTFTWDVDGNLTSTAWS